MRKIKTIYTASKWFLGGFVLIGVGVTQAIYGWIGEAMWMRALYGVVCPLLGILISLIGYAILYSEIAGTEQASETIAEAEQDAA
ncbi:hypothetical protein [Blastopirellula marina]|uniref:Uncharacterized protein n=1 Tax=Blastopirellula marina TaxID=124 RepID=A0A2S8F494_9BACT|nr:hypothetical protein [Blastopirellula marina]PQO26982.1 hypothetical protein C5Y98_27375 [Blastopirellula marina]PTL41129.1 hypothetical protein C5Y97_27390 [Blastopirellula marina]